MSSRRTHHESLADDEQPERAPVADVAVAATARDATPHYEVGEWAGAPRYACRLCHFDTLDAGQIVDHVLFGHADLFLPTPAT